MNDTQDLSQYYKVDDLSRVRVSGMEKFTNNPALIPLKDLSNTDFEQWAIRRFHQEPNPLLPDDVLEHFGKVWNYHDRVWLLNRMSVILGRPCVKLE